MAQVHLFPEGKTNRPHTYPSENDIAHLPRFKWGMCVESVISLSFLIFVLCRGRILMEADVAPVIIPMWLTGVSEQSLGIE
jgi:monolysocardiolipin acyltransferase